MPRVRSKSGTAQSYPHLSDSENAGLLDDSVLVPHHLKISQEEMAALILQAVKDASEKSSRDFLAVPVDATSEQLEILYAKHGKALFKYF